MPSIDIEVIEGVFSPGEQRELVEGAALRAATHTVVTETPSGSRAIGGRAMRAEDVDAKRAEAAVA